MPKVCENEKDHISLWKLDQCVDIYQAPISKRATTRVNDKIKRSMLEIQGKAEAIDCQHFLALAHKKLKTYPPIIRTQFSREYSSAWGALTDRICGNYPINIEDAEDIQPKNLIDGLKELFINDQSWQLRKNHILGLDLATPGIMYGIAKHPDGALADSFFDLHDYIIQVFTAYFCNPYGISSEIKFAYEAFIQLSANWMRNLMDALKRQEYDMPPVGLQIRIIDAATHLTKLTCNPLLGLEDKYFDPLNDMLTLLSDGLQRKKRVDSIKKKLDEIYKILHRKEQDKSIEGNKAYLQSILFNLCYRLQSREFAKPRKLPDNQVSLEVSIDNSHYYDAEIINICHSSYSGFVVESEAFQVKQTIENDINRIGEIIRNNHKIAIREVPLTCLHTGVETEISEMFLKLSSGLWSDPFILSCKTLRAWSADKGLKVGFAVVTPEEELQNIPKHWRDYVDTLSPKPIIP